MITRPGAPWASRGRDPHATSPTPCRSRSCSVQPFFASCVLVLYSLCAVVLVFVPGIMLQLPAVGPGAGPCPEACCVNSAQSQPPSSATVNGSPSPSCWPGPRQNWSGHPQSCCCHPPTCLPGLVCPETYAATLPPSTASHLQTTAFGDKDRPRRCLSWLHSSDTDLDSSPDPERASLYSWLVVHPRPRFLSCPTRLLREPGVPGSQDTDISFLVCTSFAQLLVVHNRSSLTQMCVYLDK